MASHTCPFCPEEYGCEHLIAEGDEQIQWFTPLVEDLRLVSEDAHGVVKASFA